MKSRTSLEEIRENNKGAVIIRYPFKVGGSIQDRCFWMSEEDGEIDYNSKQNMIEKALENGKTVIVLCWHNDGTYSIAEHK